MSKKKKKETFVYKNFGIALLVVLAAAVVTSIIPVFGGGKVYFLFLAAIIYSTIYGDFRSGGVALVLSIFCYYLLFEYPSQSPDAMGLVTLMVFGVVGFITVIVCRGKEKSDHARRIAESRYHAIFEDAITGIYVTTTGGAYVAANPKLAEILGYASPEDLMKEAANLNDVFYVSEGRRHEFQRLVEENETVAGFESEIYRRDRSRVWITENAVAVRDENGELVGFQGTTIEITDRKKAEAALRKAREELEEKVAERTAELEIVNKDLREEINERRRAEDALRQSEKMLQLVIDTIPQGICWKDRDGVYLGCNLFIAKRAGLDFCEQIVGLTDYDLPWTKEEADFYRQTDRRVMETGVAEFGIKGTVRRASGREGWTETNKVPLKNPEGETVGVLGTFKDITEQRRAEDALRERELHLRSIITAAPIVLFALDPNGVFTLCEGSGWQILGLQPDEVIGKSVFEVFKDSPEVTANARRSLAGENLTATVEITDLVFETRHTSVFDREGKVAGIIGVASDVTERTRMENELLASQRRSRDLSRHLQLVREEERKKLARELHDELGQSLTALKIDLVRLSEKTLIDEKKLTAAEIKNRIRAMVTIVDQAMDMTRKIVAELRPGALDELGLAAAMEWQVGEFQKRTGIKCGLEIEFDEDAADMNLKTTVFRILQECLTNIARHSGADAAQISLKDEGFRIFLEIEDDGRGINEREIENSHSFGILGMRERALLLGGTTEISRGARGGTRVSVSIPRPPPNTTN